MHDDDYDAYADPELDAIEDGFDGPDPGDEIPFPQGDIMRPSLLDAGGRVVDLLEWPDASKLDDDERLVKRGPHVVVLRDDDVPASIERLDVLRAMLDFIAFKAFKLLPGGAKRVEDEIWICAFYATSWPYNYRDVLANARDPIVRQALLDYGCACHFDEARAIALAARAKDQARAIAAAAMKRRA